jgi:peroxiredoxin
MVRPFRLSRSSALLMTMWGIAALQAQLISGAFTFQDPPSTLVLYGTRGADHPAMDTVAISRTGAFKFPDRDYPPGFYQLGINDTDRVDIILDPREPALELQFAERPLQRNVIILRSAENQRMWAYKHYSRAGQAMISGIHEQRASASPRDAALLERLDRQEATTRADLDRALDSLVLLDPLGQFAFAVASDRRLKAATVLGPAPLLEAFDFSDPRLLRSSAYAKAVVYYLQSSPLIDERSFHRACDALLTAAAGDTATWSYMRKHLVELFATYGPDDVAQYLVEGYVVGPRAVVPPERDVLHMAAEQLRLVPGAAAPDMILVKPGHRDTLFLKDQVPDHSFTVLFFYSSTCDHCHDQMPGLRQLVLDMDPEDLLVIGIALDATVEEFNETLVHEQINWPCYTELKGWGVQGAKDYNVKATPSIMVLDRQGRIAAKPMDHVALRAFLEEGLR